MSRKRLKADNAEQLAEIIKAIQRGEEPTQESIRRNTESAPQADSPMSGSEEGGSGSAEEDGDGFVVHWPSLKNGVLDTVPERASQKAHQMEPAGEPETQEEVPAQEDEPQDMEADEDEEEEWEGFSPKEFVQDVTARAQGFLDFIQRKKSPVTGKTNAAGTKNAESDAREKQNPDQEKTVQDTAKAGVSGDFADGRKEDRQKVTGDDPAEEYSENAWSDSGEDSWDEAESEEFGLGLLGRKRIRLTDTMEEKERFRPSKWGLRKPERSDEADDLDEAEEPAAKSESEAGKSAAKSEDKSEDFSQQQKLEKLLESGQNAEMKELSGSEETSAGKTLPEVPMQRRIGSLKESEEEEAQETDTEKENLPGAKKSGNDKKSDMNFRNRLRDHGIGGREIGMLVIGVILAILIVVLVGKTITGMIEGSNKSENVTADKGLKVLVEEEPTSWSNTYPVQLKFKVSGASITEIRINGTVCTADDQGIVTYEAKNGQLEAEVDTDKSQTLKASIEIPMLDGDAPVVHAARKQDQIELTATDARSTVTGIYYAAVDDTAMMDLPEYQKYSGPIAYTENTMYYFYAEDAAGNCSVPVATNMEAPKKLVLEQESIHLYPGGSAELMAEAEPSGALLENLQYESLDPEILSVSSSGAVTALGEGTGSIKVSADGVEAVVCTVTVSDTKTVTISTLGDCTLGTDANFSTANSFNAYDEANGHDYFFRNVKTILEQDDVTFANLEGTFTTSDDRQDKQYAFKGDPDYTEILTDGSVEVVTLANNHSGDYGEQGLADTKAALEEAGIDYCIGDTITIREVNGVKIAFIGIFVNYGTDDSENQLRADIENAKKQGAELIITAFHWGSEKATQPDETQQSLAHTAIDCGADLVVGHHPHVLQGIEKYNGKYIAYSLGNFCFGGNSNPSDMDTMIFRQTFTVSADGAKEDDDVTVIPCSISSEQGYNNYQPTPAEGEAAASIIAQLNEYSAVYGVAVADDGSVSSTENAV